MNNSFSYIVGNSGIENEESESDDDIGGSLMSFVGTFSYTLVTKKSYTDCNILFMYGIYICNIFRRSNMIYNSRGHTVFFLHFFF